MIASTNGGSLRALSGVLFVALSVAGGVLAGLLAPVPYPMPGAPSAEIVRYFTEGRAAVLVAGLLQVLAAVSLLAFVVSARRALTSGAIGARAADGLGKGAGILAASLLFLAAVLLLALTVTVEATALAGALHYVAFVTGGPAHVASLGLFVGAVSLAAPRRSKGGNLPRWIMGVGIAAATLSLACLLSFLWFPASVLIPLGRLLCFVWIVNTSLALARGGRRREAARVGEATV